MTDNQKIAGDFVRKVAKLEFPNVFNPYADSCDSHDQKNAHLIRQNNLKSVLIAALTTQIDSIWIARDLGYRGGRRTGLALTDEVHLSAHADLLGASSLSQATKGLPVSERTATVIWNVLHGLQRPIFLWNVFPLHPHELNDPFSNRCHTRSERNQCGPLLTALLNMLKPKSVVAIGRDAHLALTEFGVSSYSVRHPSYGGQNDFVRGVAKHYSQTSAPTGC